jgi:hypothetical protein
MASLLRWGFVLLGIGLLLLALSPFAPIGFLPGPAFLLLGIVLVLVGVIAALLKRPARALTRSGPGTQ